MRVPVKTVVKLRPVLRKPACSLLSQPLRSGAAVAASEGDFFRKKENIFQSLESDAFYETHQRPV